VAAALNVTEAAAQSRVHRALEKLRKIFAKRGVTLTATVIAGAVAANSVQAAPVGLAKAVTALAVAKGATASISTLTLIKGTLKVMAWTHMKTAIVVGVGVLFAAGTTTVVVKVISDRPMVVQGKTESEWIKSIVYFGDDNQIELWRSLGPKGIQMLVRALKSTSDDGQSKTVQEATQMSINTRMRAASLLAQLKRDDDAKIAISELVNLIKTEKYDSVRAIELACFEGPIEQMTEKEKAALFPELVLALDSRDSSVRNNVLFALEYYPDQSDTVVPLMVKSLQDSVPQVRLMAVRALNKVDPQNAANADFVPVLVGCLADTDGAANDAVRELGELHRDPNLAVPALIESLHSERSFIRNNSAYALGRFGKQAKAAVPALQKALGDTDPNVRGQAAAALKRINSDDPAK
jgi:HEAT repeat protein